MSNRIVNFVPVKQGIYEQSPTKKGDLGSVLEFEDGRKFVYSLNGSTDTLTTGAVIQGPVEASADVGQTIPTGYSIAISDTSVTITTGAEYTANQFQDGWLVIDDGTAGKLGHCRKIKSHPAAESGASLVITVYDAFTDTAVAGTETVSLTKNPYSGVMLQNNATDGPLLGVAPIDVTADYYFWLQVSGPIAVIGAEASIVAGTSMTADNAAETVIMADGANDQIIGNAMRSQADDGDAFMVFLTLR